MFLLYILTMHSTTDNNVKTGSYKNSATAVSHTAIQKTSKPVFYGS